MIAIFLLAIHTHVLDFKTEWDIFNIVTQWSFGRLGQLVLVDLLKQTCETNMWITGTSSGIGVRGLSGYMGYELEGLGV